MDPSYTSTSPKNSRGSENEQQSEPKPSQPTITSARPRGRPRKYGQQPVQSSSRGRQPNNCQPSSSKAPPHEPSPAHQAKRQRVSEKPATDAGSDSDDSDDDEEIGQSPGDFSHHSGATSQIHPEDDGVRKGDMKIPNGLQKVMSRDADNLPNLIAKTRKWSRENELHGKRLDAFMKRFVVPVQYDADWTTADEVEFDDNWGEDPVAAVRVNYGGTGKHLIRLWKFTYRFLNCSPFEIVSPEFLLEFDTTENGLMDIDGIHMKMPRWSAEFMKRLRTLVVHPFFDGDIAMLATAIQYTVICRTNDARRWRVRILPQEQGFLHMLCEAMDNPVHKNQPVPEVHKAVKQIQAQGSKRGLSKVMDLIEKVAWNSDVPPKMGALTPCYFVRSEDLGNLTTALDSLITFGVPMYMPAETIEKWAAVSLVQYGFPSGPNIDWAVTAVLKDQQRKLLRDAERRQKSLTANLEANDERHEFQAHEAIALMQLRLPGPWDHLLFPFHEALDPQIRWQPPIFGLHRQ
ncbi:hypothetical protein B0H63DRAFT_450478 [Podospora didyma]|uniref:Uncharacterized protein n=1 Tax=Podospora didyma TaxID=330526 RepID=A0AAE0NGJ9_9PEZI|nr:hypothetical protein B0H63DRAFT_450478 [Podospora didyma]